MGKKDGEIKGEPYSRRIIETSGENKEFKFIAVPFASGGAALLMSRCRAIVCSQYEQACEQASACSIAPYGTARRNAQLQVCINLIFNNVMERGGERYGFT